MRKLANLTNSDIIQRLRSAGYYVQVRHDRAYCEVWVDASSTCRVLELQLSPTGGSTVVCLKDTQGNVHCGISVCRTDESFCKKFGVTVALGRAIKAAGLNKKSLQKLSQSSGLGRLNVLDTFALDTVNA